MARFATAGWWALFLSAGLCAAHYPMLLSGFGRMDSDLIDGRFLNAVLEHQWRWWSGAPHHESLWSPPFFFPADNVAAYSDPLLASAPPYFAARWAGLAMDSAHQAWLLALGALNFASLAAFARLALGVSPLASAVAGALFAFAGPRLAEAGFAHHQLFTQFWTALALLALAVALRADGAGTRRVAAFLVAPAVACQLWSSFYLGWFVGLAAPLGLACCAALVGARETLRVARPLVAPLLAGGAVAALLLAPLASHYLEAASSAGMRTFDELIRPLPAAWLNPGETSLLYGRLVSHPLWLALFSEPGQPLGFGLLTPALALAGLALGRRRPWLVTLAVTALALVVLSTRVGEASAWRWVFAWVPGAAAVRAVTRAALLVAIPVALAAAVALDRFEARFARRALGSALAAILGLFCLAEQAKTMPFFDKAWNRAIVGEIAAQVDPAHCDAFHYAAIAPVAPPWKYSLDAMWASLESGVPTLNGYSGWHPPGWDLGTSTLRSAADEARLSEALARWEARTGLDPARVCRVWLRARS